MSQSPSPKTKAKMLAEAAQGVVAKKAPSASFKRGTPRRTPMRKKASKAASPQRRRSTPVAIPELTQEEFNRIAQEKIEKGFKDPRRLGPHHHYTPDKKQWKRREVLRDKEVYKHAWTH